MTQRLGRNRFQPIASKVDSGEIHSDAHKGLWMDGDNVVAEQRQSK